MKMVVLETYQKKFLPFQITSSSPTSSFRRNELNSSSEPSSDLMQYRCNQNTIYLSAKFNTTQIFSVLASAFYFNLRNKTNEKYSYFPIIPLQ